MSDMNPIEIPPAGKKAVAVIGGLAATGAVVGSAVPGIGTVIGAGVGGILGGIWVIANKVLSDE